MNVLSHDRYQYDNPIRSKHTGACPRQHSQQLFWRVALDRLHLQVVDDQDTVSDISPQENVTRH
jgi:hypothetical protein